jgi:large subunit ribosomal protein L5
MAKKNEGDQQPKKHKHGDGPPVAGGKPPKGEKQAKGEGQAKGEKREKGAKGEKAAAGKGGTVRLESRLVRHYREVASTKLTQQFGWKNKHQVPRIEKVTVNCGLGEASKNQKLLDSVVEEMRLITGQKPLITRARKAIANFGLRENMPIGVAVTLRGERMYHFVDRLVSVAIPRIRDFRGLPTRSFDGRGNYTMGVKEQIIFPEIDYDRVQKIHGLDITIVTSTNKDGRSLRATQGNGLPVPRRVPPSSSDKPPRSGSSRDDPGERDRHGQEVPDREGQAQAEVRGATQQPLPALRPAARLHPQVRHVPDLLP